MAHEQALFIVNSLHDQLASLVRSVVQALNDGKVSAWEGWALGMKGMTTASTVIALLQEMDPATRAEILQVIEHGNWTMPDTSGPEQRHTQSVTPP